MGTGSEKAKIRGQVALRPGLAVSLLLNSLASREPFSLFCQLGQSSTQLTPTLSWPQPTPALPAQRQLCMGSEPLSGSQVSSPLRSMESYLLDFKLSRKDTANHHCSTVDGTKVGAGPFPGGPWNRWLSWPWTGAPVHLLRSL